MLPHPKAQVCCLNFDNKCPILTTLVDHLSCLFSYSMSFLVFDNAYHHFLINTIVENNANNFATAPPLVIQPQWCHSLEILGLGFATILMDWIIWTVTWLWHSQLWTQQHTLTWVHPSRRQCMDCMLLLLLNHCWSQLVLWITQCETITVVSPVYWHVRQRQQCISRRFSPGSRQDEQAWSDERSATT